MATIAAFIDGPGLGQPVLDGLKRGDVGGAFVPGMLHRGDGGHARPHHDGGQRARRAGRAAAAATARAAPDRAGRRRRSAPLVAVYLSRSYVWAWRSSPRAPTRRRRLADAVDAFVDWFTDTFGGSPRRIKDLFTNGFLNPLQALLAESPWWLVAAGDPRARLRRSAGSARWSPTVVCLAGICCTRPLARRDDHADHDPGRHRAGDGAGGGLRSLDGPQPRGRPRAPRRCSTPARRSRRSST